LEFSGRLFLTGVSGMRLKGMIGMNIYNDAPFTIKEKSTAKNCKAPFYARMVLIYFR
jgi:hypothetical protein